MSPQSPSACRSHRPHRTARSADNGRVSATFVLSLLVHGMLLLGVGFDAGERRAGDADAGRDPDPDHVAR